MQEQARQETKLGKRTSNEIDQDLKSEEK